MNCVCEHDHLDHDDLYGCDRCLCAEFVPKEQVA